MTRPRIIFLSLATLLALSSLATLSSIAIAQPMIDPSRMSGMPRPDPSVPPGRLIVRVIRGDFAHPVIGETVTLDGPGGARTAKVDEAAHATFDGLTTGRGTYTVSATAFGETLTSQPIEMPPAPGVKIMLVFKADEAALLGEHDGVARADKTLPVGRIEISVVDVNDKPLPGLDVILAHLAKDAAAKAPEEKTAKTDAEGKAQFDATPAAVVPGDGYIAAVKKEGLSASGKPFRLDEKTGMRLGLRALALTHRLDVLSIGRRSHIILEVKDDEVNVIENLMITNAATDPFEAKSLSFPLPAEAEGIQVAPESAAGSTVEGKSLVLRGVLPPGDTALSFGFVLPRKGNAIELAQTLPIEMEQVVAVTDRLPGMTVDGDRLEKVERELNGRPFWVISGPPIKAGERLRISLDGLPHRSTAARDLALALMIGLVVWGVVASVTARPLGEARQKLEVERKSLLDELAALDGKAAASAAAASSNPRAEAKQNRRREELVDKLEEVYRQLDEGAPAGRS